MNARALIQVFIIISMILINATAQDQTYRSNVSKRGTTAANFLEIGVGARALALGSAFTALADDPSTIYWNVGGLAKLKRHGFMFNHSEWIADINFDFISGSFNFGKYGAVGLSITALTMGDDEPEGNGQIFRAADFAVSLAYSYRLTDRFAIGVNSKVIRQKIWEMSAVGFAVDLGVHYATPFKGLNLGMSITNFGTQMKLSGPNSLILYDPNPSSSGNNGRIPGEIQMTSWPLPLNFRIGLAYNLFNTEYHNAVIAVDAEHPNNNYESVSVGAEYVYRKMIAIRGGYNTLFLEDAEESISMGAGIIYPLLGNVLLRFDFAYADFGLFDNVYKYTVGIEF
jgi:long-subunit fatty acid transport protein